MTTPDAHDPSLAVTGPESSFDPEVKSTHTLLNLTQTSLTALHRKGNLVHAIEQYNPLGFFAEVHHISFDPKDRDFSPLPAWLKPHVIRTGGPKLPLWSDLLAVRRVVRRASVDLIRARDTQLAGLLAVLAGRAEKVPTVVSECRGDTLVPYPVYGSAVLGNWVERYVIRNADRFQVRSPAHRVIATKAGRKGPVGVVPMLLRQDFFDGSVRGNVGAIETRHGLSGETRYVFYFGRLTTHKKPHHILEAFPRILCACSTAHLVFCGDGVLRPEMERRAAALGLAQRVHFLGFQPMEQVAELLRSASAVVFPMAGFALIEAAALACPVVAYDEFYHADIVHHGESGLLCPVDQVEAMADSVVQLLKDPARGRAMGLALRDKIRREYDPAAIASTQIALYRELLTPAPANGRLQSLLARTN